MTDILNDYDPQLLFNAQISVPVSAIRMLTDFDEVWRGPEGLWLPAYHGLASKHGVKFHRNLCPLADLHSI